MPKAVTADLAEFMVEGDVSAWIWSLVVQWKMINGFVLYDVE